MFRVLNKSLRVPESGAFRDRSAFALEVAPHESPRALP